MSRRKRRPGRRGPILCKVKNCSRVHPPDHPLAGRPIPFKSLGGLASHRRTAHGLAAISASARPLTGRFRCDEPNCQDERPYQTLGGLGGHKRKVHGIVSTSKAAIKKAEQRAKSRGLVPVAAGKRAPLPPPPRSGSLEPHVPRRRDGSLIDPGRREYIRVRVLYMVNGPWAREIDSTPAALRDVIAELCATNFEPPRHKATRVATVDAYAVGPGREVGYHKRGARTPKG